MPSETFVDTSAWFAIVDQEERNAKRVFEAFTGCVRGGARLVTTNLVVAETHALLMRRSRRDIALRFLSQVGRTPNILVTSDQEIEARALSDWIVPFDDREFSFTDAVSFAVMKERGIREALTLDAHFATAGFVMLPGPRRSS